MEWMTVILFLLITVNAQDIVTDITSSGDGEEGISTSSSASLINENGEIQNISLYDIIASTVLDETIFETVSDTSTSLADITEQHTLPSTQSTDPLTTAVDTTTQAVDTTTQAVDSTTQAVDSTTQAVDTTTQSVDTTTDFGLKTSDSTVDYTRVTSTTQKTTLPTIRSSTATEVRGSTPLSSNSLETTRSPSHEDQPCSFLDENFVCDEDIVCYGEGEIDCTEEAESIPIETAFVQETSLAFASEDYSFEEIETFPPYLVGVKSNKKSLLFRIGSLLTTSMDDNLEGIQEGDTWPTSTHLPWTEEPSSETVDSKLQTTEGETVSEHISNPRVPVTKMESTSMSYTSSKMPNTQSVQEESTENTPVTEASSVVVSTVEDTMTTLQNITSGISKMFTEDDLSTSMEDELKESMNVRRKREDNGALASGSLHKAAFESSQKRKMQACMLRGNLICTPTPTTAKCKGKSVCQVVRGTSETSEKSTSTKGVESWAIAVIAICAIAAALTVSLLVYLIFTSWKKLKVQPQNGVTTLNYVNSSVP